MMNRDTKKGYLQGWEIPTLSALLKTMAFSAAPVAAGIALAGLTAHFGLPGLAKAILVLVSAWTVIAPSLSRFISKVLDEIEAAAKKIIDNIFAVAQSPEFVPAKFPLSAFLPLKSFTPLLNLRPPV